MLAPLVSISKIHFPARPSCDLHCHTTASDGDLAPFELYQRAQVAGVDLLAITDHDTAAGVDALLAQLAGTDMAGPALLRGIEFSTLWQNRAVHVVALGCIPGGPADAGIEQLGRTRVDRAAVIAQRVAGMRADELLASAYRASGGNAPGRPHIARAMVELGMVGSEEAAFRRHLGNGKRGDVRKSWPPLAEVIGWVADSGGVAVLAHPDAYGLTRTKLGRLIADFAAAGGVALEMALPSASGNLAAWLQDACRSRGLAASCGSDFHSDRQGWRALGTVPVIPEDIEPVWELLPVA